MPQYYFDLKNGVRVRDRSGESYKTDDEAIIAGRLEIKQLAMVANYERGVFFVIVHESGREVWRLPLSLH